MDDQTVNVRSMVDDAAAAVDFYRTHLGSQVLIEDPAGNLIELFQPVT